MRTFATVGAACVLVLAASADTLVLEDGRVFDDVEVERDGDVIKIRFEHGTVTLPTDQVRDCIIPGDPGFEPQTDDEREKIADGYVFYEDRWVRPEQRERAIEKLLEEQTERVEALKESRLWRNRRTEETKHFKFVYTVPQHIFERYRDLIEAYYDEFEDTFKLRPPRDLEPLEVSFYVDYDAFLQVTGVPRGVLGFFKFVSPYQLAIYYDRLDPVRTEQVIYHEIGHYLQKLIDVEFKYPHWPGESIGEYYGGSAFDERTGKLRTGLVLESRLAQIQLDMKEGDFVSLEDMIRGAEQRNFHDYTWGWSFVHFLMNDKRYAKSFPKFMLALARDRKVDRYGYSIGRDRLKTVTGETMYEVFCDEMGIRKPEDLADMQKDWHAYVEDELTISSARGLEESAYYSARNDRFHRAKRLFQEAEELGGMSPHGYHRYAEVLDTLDEHDEARAKWRLAIAGDPLVSDYYIALGESLLESDSEDEKNEGKELLQLAFEIEPDNFYLERNLERLLKK